MGTDRTSSAAGREGAAARYAAFRWPLFGAERHAGSAESGRGRCRTSGAASAPATERCTVEGVGEVVLVRSARARRIRLTVRPSGEVRLTLPRGVAKREALAFALAKRGWIAASRARMAARRPVAEPLDAAGERLRIESLRRAARSDLPERVERAARRFGFVYGKVSIRVMRTRWGSCSPRNDLSLNLYLMLLPEPLRDYVIVHELCHTVHHDHSPRFHALVNRCLDGREAEFERALKRYRIVG